MNTMIKLKNLLLTANKKIINSKLIKLDVLLVFVRLGLLTYTKPTKLSLRINLVCNLYRSPLLKHIVCYASKHKRIIPFGVAMKLLKSSSKNIYILSTPYGLKTLAEAVTLKTGGILICKVVV